MVKKSEKKEKSTGKICLYGLVFGDVLVLPAPRPVNLPTDVTVDKSDKHGW